MFETVFRIAVPVAMGILLGLWLRRARRAEATSDEAYSESVHELFGGALVFAIVCMLVAGLAWWLGS